MAERITATTQEHLDILDIKNDLVVLKNGTVCAVLQTTAVNFDLLSEIEQDAIIAAFSMLLNSITFTVQVFLRSKRLDISKYIEKVQRIESKITDPLLKRQAEAYRKFIQEIIKRNDVLDKKFYVIVPAHGSSKTEAVGTTPFEWISRLLGLHTRRSYVNVDRVLQESKIQIAPKVEHLIGEFNRIGIRTRQLNTQEMVELFFDIYNPSAIHGQRIRTNINDYKTAIVNPAILEE